MTALVTGGTGFIGSDLVPRLAEQWPRLLLLVRAESLARARLLLEAWKLGSRVSLVVGDVTSKGLGLERQDRVRLRRSITYVFHLAADYGPGKSGQTLRASIVDGTQNLLLLARGLPRLQGLFHVSTAHVCGRAGGRIYEDGLLPRPRFHNLYEECKYDAERLVREATDLKVTVFRPSMVVGDSRNGSFQKLSGPYRLIQALDRGWFKVLPGPCVASLHVVPVDYVTRAVAALARQPDSAGKTFHLCDPSPRSARFFIEETSRLLDISPPRLAFPWALARRVPVPSWRHGVEILNQEVRFETANTTRALRGTGITCPPVESYIPKMVRAWTERRQ